MRRPIRLTTIDGGYAYVDFTAIVSMEWNVGTDKMDTRYQNGWTTVIANGGSYTPSFLALETPEQILGMGRDETLTKVKGSYGS